MVPTSSWLRLCKEGKDQQYSEGVGGHDTWLDMSPWDLAKGSRKACPVSGTWEESERGG